MVSYLPQFLYKWNIGIAWHPCYRVLMIVSFKDKASEDLFNGISSRVARKACPQALWRVTTRKLDQLDSVQLLDELKIPPVIVSKRYLVREKASKASVLTSNIEFVLNGVNLAQKVLKL
jgi:plasmid maintenance system killer protein